MKKIFIFLFVTILLSFSYKVSAQFDSNKKYYHLKGEIGNKYAITMDLFISNEKMSGKYYYDYVGIPISLEGTINDDNTFELSESIYDDDDDVVVQKGTFIGKFNDNNSISGTWTNIEKTLSLTFELKENYQHSAKFEFYNYQDSIHLQNNNELPTISMEFHYAIPTSTPIETGYDTLMKNFKTDIFINPECKNIDDCIDDFVENCVSAYNENANDFETEELHALYFYWELWSSSNIFYNDKDFLTLTDSRYEFTGGAHGNTDFIYYIFDLKTGKKLKSEDIFTKSPKILEMIKTKIIEEGYEESVFSMDEIFVTENIGIDGYYVYFFYNQYEIAPYVVGPIEITISYKELFDFLTPKFKERMGLEE